MIVLCLITGGAGALPAAADGPFLVVLGVVVALEDHGAAVAKVVFFHVDVAFQVAGEDVFDKLGQERVLV